MPKTKTPNKAQPKLHRLSVDLPVELYNAVTLDLGFGNLNPLVRNLFQALDTQMRQGQSYLPKDIASGRRVRVVVD